MGKYPLSVMWLRRDLRLEDNTALSEACAQSERVAVVFVFDTNILKRLSSETDRRVTYIYDSLKDLDEQLKKLGSQLIVRFGDPVVEIPEVVKVLKAKALFFNEDYVPYAIKRDSKVCSSVKAMDVDRFSFKDHVIFSGTEIMKSDKSPYKVFTPYKRLWLKTLKTSDYSEKKVKDNFIKLKEVSKLSKDVQLEDMGFSRAQFHFQFQEPGRANALKSLKTYTRRISEYHETRDYPYLDEGTSGLSTHLRFGTLSIRECVQVCRKTRSEGSRVWLSELIWRDFYHMILNQFPHVAKHAFKLQYDGLSWSQNSDHFKAWCEGRTGYPLVDAGMRQLNETGWMHNRLRMVTASFLVKDLLIDWRKGERYFAEKLLDFDFAANNGGWQWCASTGCDAQPYFRVFNPVLQSQKFDPEGEFIRRWVPELSGKSKKEIHFPLSENLELGEGGDTQYVRPIVSHGIQKKLAIQMFKSTDKNK